MLGFRDVFIKLNPRGRDEHNAGASISNWEPIGSAVANNPCLIVVYGQHYWPTDDTQERQQMFGWRQ